MAILQFLGGKNSVISPAAAKGGKVEIFGESNKDVYAGQELKERVNSYIDVFNPKRGDIGHKNS